MKIDELEIKHLAPYLSFNLNISVCGNERVMTLDDEMDSLTISLRDTFEGLHKPLLRPLSDLSKEIEHNGETFSPLRVLFKLACDGYHYKFFKEEIAKSWGGVDILRIYSSDDYYTEFVYGDNCFNYRYVNLKTKFGGNNTISNQLLLHQKLFEWHFDVFGLIENDLAIII